MNFPQVDEEVCLIASLAPEMKAVGATIFALLWRRRGWIVPYSSLLQDLFDLTGRERSESGLSKAVSRVRAAIPPEWPVRITAHTSLGYRLDVTDPGWTWMKFVEDQTC